jgi:hypothetical protein
MSSTLLDRTAAPPVLQAPRGRPWDTVARLRLALGATVVAGLLLAGPALAGFALRAAAVDDARAEATHLVTVQTGHTRLLTADALAPRTILTATPLGTTLMNHYGYAVQEATIRAAHEAGDAQDRDTLASAAAGVQQYAREVERGQQLARDGDSRSPAVLRAAQRELQREVLPRLDAVGVDSRARLAADLDRAGVARLVIVVVLAASVLVLALVQVWLARRTRRVVNVGLVLATLATVAAGWFAVDVLADSAKAGDSAARRTPVVEDLVAARLGIFRAFAAEGVALLPHPRGTAAVEFEPAWRRDADLARGALGRLPTDVGSEPVQLLAVYTAAHDRIRTLLEQGDRAAALRTATDPSDTGGAGSAENLDVTTSAALARTVHSLDDDLARAGDGLWLAGWSCLVAGISVAVLGWWGIGRRLAEYR